jgi:hypothetical protein
VRYKTCVAYSDNPESEFDERWRGGVFVPDELLPLIEAA